MFSAKFNLLKPFSRLVKKQQLETLDYVYKAQPFCDVVSKNQNTYNLDTVYRAMPFVGTPNNYIRRIMLSGINHPDVENWLNTVNFNGGSASETTISALNTFCNSIDNAGLRNKFYRLNLFCGNNLQACLVPIYTGPISNLKIQSYGYGIDLNSNFTNSNYNETGVNAGLTGNGVNTSLNTGLSPDLVFSDTSAHLSYYGVEWTPTAVLNPGSAVLGATNSSATQRFFILGRGNTGTCGGSVAALTGQLGDVHSGVSCQANNNIINGFYITSRLSTMLGSLYRNGSQISFSTFTNSYASFNEFLRVFAYGINGASAGFSAIRLIGYSVGTGMTSAEAATFNTIMQTFQTTLNRTV